MDPIKHWIDGRQTDSAECFVTINPAMDKVIAEVAPGSKAEINATVAAAETAFPAWADTPAKQCAKLMRRLGGLIEQNTPHLAAPETMDTDLPIAQTSKQLVPHASENSHFSAKACTQVNGRTYPVDDQMLNYTLYQSVSVRALISPWSVPFMTATWRVASCLALDDMAVLKMSELSPLAADQLDRLALEAGIPPGVLNVVQGYGATAGNALVHHLGVRVVSFTSGTTTGKCIVERADLKKFSMELSSKLPVLVFDDADLDRALDTSLFTIFSVNGEHCTAGSRIFVQESACGDFVHKFAEHARRLMVGDPADETTHVGSMITHAHWKKVTDYVHLGEQEGARILTGGAEEPAGLPGHLQSGNFVTPTVLANVDNRMRVVQEEIFGPVTYLIPSKDEADGLKLANDVEYGLASYTWTQGVGKVHRVARETEAGIVFVDSQNVRDLRQSFGSAKASGIGYEGGEYNLEVFAETKNVCISMGSRHIPRWGA